jgi:hypothetical protein
MSKPTTPRHEHSHNERLKKLRELSDEQLRALRDSEGAVYRLQRDPGGSAGAARAPSGARRLRLAT